MPDEVPHPLKQHRVLHAGCSEAVVDDGLEGTDELRLVEGLGMLKMSDERFAGPGGMVWPGGDLQAGNESICDGLVLGRRSGIPWGGQRCTS